MYYTIHGAKSKVTFNCDARSDGPTNMARDVCLLNGAEEGELGCRVYSWDGPWVSLGKQQIPERDLLEPQSVRWVMRPTGGRAVLHGHDITVGLAVPLSLIAAQTSTPVEILARSIKTLYRFLAAPLVQAMNACGYEVVLAENLPSSLPTHPSSNCFASVSPNDIVYLRGSNVVKACGCALRVSSKAVLVQASIPNGKPLVEPSTIFTDSQELPHPIWNSGAFSEYLKASLLNFKNSARRAPVQRL